MLLGQMYSRQGISFSLYKTPAFCTVLYTICTLVSIISFQPYAVKGKNTQRKKIVNICQSRVFYPVIFYKMSTIIKKYCCRFLSKG